MMIVAHLLQTFQPAMMRVESSPHFFVALQTAEPSTGGLQCPRESVWGSHRKVGQGDDITEFCTSASDGMCSAPTSTTQAPRKVCVLTDHMRITKRLRPRWNGITRSRFHQRTDSRAPELEQC